jgi:site-specific recombinase
MNYLYYDLTYKENAEMKTGKRVQRMNYWVDSYVTWLSIREDYRAGLIGKSPRRLLIITQQLMRASERVYEEIAAIKSTFKRGAV